MKWTEVPAAKHTFMLKEKRELQRKDWGEKSQGKVGELDSSSGYSHGGGNADGRCCVRIICHLEDPVHARGKSDALWVRGAKTHGT